MHIRCFFSKMFLSKIDNYNFLTETQNSLFLLFLEMVYGCF